MVTACHVHGTTTASRLRLLGLGAVFGVLVEDEVVGHAGDVVADYSWQGFAGGLLLVVGRQGCRIRHPEGEQVADYAFGSVFFWFEG